MSGRLFMALRRILIDDAPSLKMSADVVRLPGHSHPKRVLTRERLDSVTDSLLIQGAFFSWNSV